MAEARSWSISPSRHFCIHVVHVPLRQSYGRRSPASSASSRMYSSSATSTVTPLFLNVILCVLATGQVSGPRHQHKPDAYFDSKSSPGAPQTGHSSGGATPSSSSPQTVQTIATVIGGGGAPPPPPFFFSPAAR